MTSLINKTSKTQTLVSACIYLVLVVTASGILIRQFDLNPAVNVMRQQDSPGLQSPETRAFEAIVPLEGQLLPITPAEQFGPDTLSDKINGKAELYLSAHFKSLKTQRFKGLNDSSWWIEIYIYDMATGENAYAVYSSQMRDDAQPIDVGQYAYRTPNALFWVHGPYYVEAIASAVSTDAVDAMEAAAQAFVKKIRVKASRVTLQTLFPPEGLEQDSIKMIPADVFGYDRFDKVLIADYQQGSHTATAFLSKRANSDEAAALADGFHAFLLNFGGIAQPPMAELPHARIVEIFDTFDIVFKRGRYLAGIHEAADLDLALALARKLDQRLTEAGDDK